MGPVSWDRQQLLGNKRPQVQRETAKAGEGTWGFGGGKGQVGLGYGPKAQHAEGK